MSRSWTGNNIGPIETVKMADPDGIMRWFDPKGLFIMQGVNYSLSDIFSSVSDVLEKLKVAAKA